MVYEMTPDDMKLAEIRYNLAQIEWLLNGVKYNLPYPGPQRFGPQHKIDIIIERIRDLHDDIESYVWVKVS